MIEAEWWDYDSAEELAAAVAGDVGFIIESALDARNECLLALPGGKSPIPVFEKLAQQKFPWKRVTIVPGDDRPKKAIGLTPDPLPPEAPVARVTLTRSAILSARAILITIDGDEKKQVLEDALEEGAKSDWPIGRVLADAEQPIDIHWRKA